MPRPRARPRRAKKKSSPPPPHGGLTRRHGGLFEAPSADPPWSPCVTRAPGEDDFFVRPAGLSGAHDAARARAFDAPGFDTLRGLGRPQRPRRDVSACREQGPSVPRRRHRRCAAGRHGRPRPFCSRSRLMLAFFPSSFFPHRRAHGTIAVRSSVGKHAHHDSARFEGGLHRQDVARRVPPGAARWHPGLLENTPSRCGAFPARTGDAGPAASGDRTAR